MNKRDKLYFELKEKMNLKLLKVIQQYLFNNPYLIHFSEYLGRNNRWWNITHNLIYHNEDVRYSIEIALLSFNNVSNKSFVPIDIKN